MKWIQNAVAFLLCGSLAVAAAGGAWASVGEASPIKDNTATEYNSEDLITPLDEITVETMAGAAAPEVAAKSYVLMEPQTGQVLLQGNANEALPPASITKIMSLLLVMEAIDSGKLSLDTIITASDHACSMGGSQIWLEPGETMTVHELLKAAVIASANDATVALGEAVAGSEEGFVAMMNQRAEQLGMQDTHFENATGLDAEGHLTSALDVGKMSCELLKHELIKNYSTVWMDSLREGEIGLVNTNKLVRYYEGCIGLKTGTTGGAGHCLSAAAQKGELQLVAVVMGSANSNDRFNSARKLLDYGFANWEFAQVQIQPQQLQPVTVKNGVQLQVSPAQPDAAQFLVQKGKMAQIEVQITMEPALRAPVEQGQTVGVARILLEGQELGTIRLCAAQRVEKMNYVRALLRLLGAVFTA